MMTGEVIVKVKTGSGIEAILTWIKLLLCYHAQIIDSVIEKMPVVLRNSFIEPNSGN